MSQIYYNCRKCSFVIGKTQTSVRTLLSLLQDVRHQWMDEEKTCKFSTLHTNCPVQKFRNTKRRKFSFCTLRRVEMQQNICDDNKIAGLCGEGLHSLKMLHRQVKINHSLSIVLGKEDLTFNKGEWEICNFLKSEKISKSFLSHITKDNFLVIMMH